MREGSEGDRLGERARDKHTDMTHTHTHAHGRAKSEMSRCCKLTDDKLARRSPRLCTRAKAKLTACTPLLCKLVLAMNNQNEPLLARNHVQPNNVAPVHETAEERDGAMLGRKLLLNRVQHAPGRVETAMTFATNKLELKPPSCVAAHRFHRRHAGRETTPLREECL